MRRRTLLHTGAGMAFWTQRGLFAEQLARTPSVEEGPYYPNQLRADTDNDLLILNDGITPAVGEVAHLGGRVLDANGEPVRNAEVEIWQVDHNGVYLKMHTRDGVQMDPNFQGYGRFLTGSTGDYYFRTIKPVPYRGRPAPHIHFKIRTKGHEPWTTQTYIAGHPGNERDGLYRRIPAEARGQVTLAYQPLPGSRTGELTAKFDIVLGWTPEG